MNKELSEKEEIKNLNEIKKEYLKQLRDTTAAVQRIEEQIRTVELDEMLPSIQGLSDMPHGSSTHKDLSDYIVKKDKLVSLMIKMKYQRITLYQEIFSRIELLEDENERAVLTYRYINGYDWEKIANKMCYAWQHIHKIHAKALFNLTIPEEYIEEYNSKICQQNMSA